MISKEKLVKNKKDPCRTKPTRGLFVVTATLYSFKK
jgi:hypothetical protein